MRDFKRWDSLNEPLFWNTLDEAVDWLSEKTGKQWTRNKIINFAIGVAEAENKGGDELNWRPCQDRALFKVLVPISAEVGAYKYKNDTGTKFGSPHPAPLGNQIVKTGYRRQKRTAPLSRTDLYELLLYGETSISFICAKIDYWGKWYFELFEPVNKDFESMIMYESQSCDGILYPDFVIELGNRFSVSLGMIGIARDDLNYLLSYYLSSKEACQRECEEDKKRVAANCDGELGNVCQETCDEFTDRQCRSYDPVRKKQISALFSEKLSEKEWTSKFDKAARNGLSSARQCKDGRFYLYNPVKVAEWLIQNGYYSREQIARKLDRNLPPRSSSFKGLLFVEDFNM